MSNSAGILAGKVVFIAGVGPQMGSATARIAAREGAKVVLAARGADLVERVADSIRAAGGDVLPLQCDLSDKAQVRAAVDAALAAYGRVDGVFYNAGYYDHQQEDLELDEDVWRMSMDVNLMGPLWLTRFTIPSMLKNGGGAFVFNSSAASMVAEDVRVGYGVSKGGLNSLMRFVATRYGRDGIRANATFPSVVPEAMASALTSLSCLGRSGTADEIGEVVAFLLSDRASIITGQIIHLDGGIFAKAHWPSFKPPAKASG
jgi:NAD(P)-dependent dehydrogenase (short-subunit alcohol dehydrogenase family)